MRYKVKLKWKEDQGKCFIYRNYRCKDFKHLIQFIIKYIDDEEIEEIIIENE